MRPWHFRSEGSEKVVEPAPKVSWWSRHGRRLLVRAVVLQLVGVVLFTAALLLGERSHVSFFALYLPRQPVLLVSVGALLVTLRLKHRALLAVQVVAALVVLFPVMGARLWFSPSPTAADLPVRLATYNVYFGKMGRPLLLEELATMPVDILLLQATYDSIGERLRERLPDRTTRQDGELVIVTRFPILKVNVPPQLPGDVRPMFVEYLLETPAGPLRVFNIHPFSPRNALVDRDEAWTVDVARREAQIAAVVEASRQPGPPFVIAGDTNLPQLSAILRRHLGDLKDAFDEAGLGFGYTFPAKRPWMRIDRALGGRGVTFTGVRVGPQGASDHRPLFADFRLSPSKGS